MTNRLASHAVAAALLLAAASFGARLGAQPAPPTLPDTGTRVRVVVADRGRVVGTLAERTPDRWLVVRERGDTVAVAPLQVERLDVSRGRRSPGAAFWRGAGVGALVGGTVTVAGLGILAVTGELACTDCFFPPVLVVGVGGTALTLATTLVGGIVGTAVRERWRRVPLPGDARLGIVGAPSGAGLAVRLALPR